MDELFFNIFQRYKYQRNLKQDQVWTLYLTRNNDNGQTIILCNFINYIFSSVMWSEWKCARKFNNKIRMLIWFHCFIVQHRIAKLRSTPTCYKQRYHWSKNISTQTGASQHICINWNYGSLSQFWSIWYGKIDFTIKQTNFWQTHFFEQLKFEYYQRTLAGNYILLFMTTMPVCEVTKSKFYPKILAVSNLPPADTCPMPKVSILAWPQFLNLLKFILYSRGIIQLIIWSLMSHSFHQYYQPANVTF